MWRYKHGHERRSKLKPLLDANGRAIEIGDRIDAEFTGTQSDRSCAGIVVNLHDYPNMGPYVHFYGDDDRKHSTRPWRVRVRVGEMADAETYRRLAALYRSSAHELNQRADASE